MEPHVSSKVEGDDYFPLYTEIGEEKEKLLIKVDFIDIGRIWERKDKYIGWTR